MSGEPKTIPASRAATKPLLRALGGERVTPPPIWLMRQAGRYLAEYRAVRAQAGSFMALCLDPALAAEVTMQPIRRFGFDAAILFSDILMVPHGLGQRVGFEDGIGPQLEALEDGRALSRLSSGPLATRLAPVYRAIELVRSELPETVTLVGFAGAPWTVASYMIEGGPSDDHAKAKAWMTRDPAAFERLIALLIEATTAHLCAQAAAGAEALQLFDSWAGALAEPERRRWCLAPAAGIVARVKRRFPETRMILFPRGAGSLYRDYAAIPGVDALSLGTDAGLEDARDELQGKVALQGNLDPKLLVAGGRKMHEAVGRILDRLAGGPFVFNLGHGILPETPIAHVAELVAQVRAHRR